MRLAVDGSCWGGRERGVAAATRRLWSAMLERTPRPQVTVFATAALAAQLPRASLLDVGPLPGPRRFLWQQLRLPRLVRALGIELLHCPSYTAPVGARCKTIVTLHDVIAWSHPGLAGVRNAAHLRLLVGRSVRHARAVCVPTRCVARAATQLFAIDPARLFVVPWGVDAELVRLPRSVAARMVLARFAITEPFVLCCGCLEAKKNLDAAVHAAAAIRSLVVAVGPWIASSARVLARARGAADARIRYLGYVSPRELSALYAAASALIYPSYAEGFGLPPVEAMRCGCPVVVSDIPALREVCGDAALYAPADDHAAFAAALRALARDRVVRTELIARATERAEQFTWRAAADRFAEAIDHAERG